MEEVSLEVINSIDYSGQIKDLNDNNMNSFFIAILKAKRYDLLTSNSISINFEKKEESIYLVGLLFSEYGILPNVIKRGYKISEKDKEAIFKIIIENYVTDYTKMSIFVSSLIDDEISSFVKEHKEEFVYYIDQNEDSIDYELNRNQSVVELILLGKKEKLIDHIEEYSIDNLKLLSKLVSEGVTLKHHIGCEEFAIQLFENKDNFSKKEFCSLLQLLVHKRQYNIERKKEPISSFNANIIKNIDYLIECVSEVGSLPKCLVESEIFRNECIKKGRIDLAVQCTLPYDIVENPELVKKYCDILHLDTESFYVRYTQLIEYYKVNKDIFGTFLATSLRNPLYSFNKEHFERMINDVEVQMALERLNDDELEIISKIINKFDYNQCDISTMTYNIIKNIACYKELIKDIKIEDLTNSELNNLIKVLQFNDYAPFISNQSELNNYKYVKQQKYLHDIKYNNIELSKDDLLKSMFNISLKEAQRINNLYCYNRNECVIDLLSQSELPKDVFQMLSILHNIVETDDMTAINTCFNNYRDTDMYEEPIPLETFIRSRYSELYSKTLFKVDERESADGALKKDREYTTVNYQGHSINVCIPTGEIEFLLHCVGSCSLPQDVINTNYQRDWEGRPQIQDHYVACSYVDEYRLYSLRTENTIVFGFNNLEGGSLYGMGDTDIDSVGEYAKTYDSSAMLMNQGDRAHFFVPSLLLNSNVNGYNEVVIERRNNSGFVGNNFKRRPDYIIMTVESMDKSNFILMDDLLSTKYHFLSEEEKHAIKGSTNNTEVLEILKRHEQDIIEAEDTVSMSGKDVISLYCSYITKAKNYENNLKASSDFGIPMVVVDRSYYFKKILANANCYDEETKNNILQIYEQSETYQRKKLLNLIMNQESYDKIQPKQQTSAVSTK